MKEQNPEADEGSSPHTEMKNHDNPHGRENQCVKFPRRLRVKPPLLGPERAVQGPLKSKEAVVQVP